MTLAAQSTKDSKYIHDTAKLMQNYRDVLWNVEVSEQNLQAEFRAEYGAANGIQITDLDISNPRLEGDAQSIARSKKMLQLIDSSVNLIRERHKKGEFYYLILYYSYLPRSVLRTPMKFYMHLNRKAFRFLCEFTMVAARKHSKFSVPFCGGTPPLRAMIFLLFLTI